MKNLDYEYIPEDELKCIRDASLIKCYHKGFSDELDGSSSIVSDDDVENNAYKLGALHAIVGDDVRSVDYLSDEEILKLIKKY